MSNVIIDTVLETDLEQVLVQLDPFRRQTFVARMMAKYGATESNKALERQMATPLYAQMAAPVQLEWHSAS